MRTFVLVLAAVLAATGCGRAGDDGLTVVTSVLPHAWLVRQIGGEHVKVLTLVGPGESPATYQPTDRQVSDVMRSKTWFRTGVPFENGSWKSALTGSSVAVVDLREGVPVRHIGAYRHGDHVHHEGEDPHNWLSTSNLRLQAAVIGLASLSMAALAVLLIQDALGRAEETLLREAKQQSTTAVEELRQQFVETMHVALGGASWDRDFQQAFRKGVLVLADTCFHVEHLLEIPDALTRLHDVVSRPLPAHDCVEHIGIGVGAHCKRCEEAESE